MIDRTRVTDGTLDLAKTLDLILITLSKEILSKLILSIEFFSEIFFSEEILSRESPEKPGGADFTERSVRSFSVLTPPPPPLPMLLLLPLALLLPLLPIISRGEWVARLN